MKWLLLFMRRMSEIGDAVTVARLVEDGLDAEDQDDPSRLVKQDVPEGVEIYEINGPFFFGVADRVKNTLATLRKPPKVFILRMRYVPAMDATALNALEELFFKSQRQGTVLILSGIRPELRTLLFENGIIQLIGKENVHSHIRFALIRAAEITGYNKKKPAEVENMDDPIASNSTRGNTGA